MRASNEPLRRSGWLQATERHRFAVCAAMACLSAAIFSGCWWGGADGVPFYYSKKDKQQQLADLEHYGPFAFQRIETIKKMGEYAAKSPQLEKEKVAAKLASNIQTEQDPLVRMVIIRELGRIPTEISSSVLTAGIKDPDPEVRMEVCTAWGKRVHQSLAKGGGIPPGPTEDSAVRVLAGALASDTNFDVRMFAARALGEVPRDPRAIAALGIALKGSTDPAMTYNVVTSLKSVSGKDFGSDVKQWQQFADSFIPQAIVPPTGLGQQAPSAIASRPSRTN